MDQRSHLDALCRQIRAEVLTATTHAGSGHPTSSLSAVELLTVLFFGGFFRQDIAKPHDIHNDRFILSKGHASPLLYALYKTAGALTEDDLLKLRDAYSRLEGHPTPLFPYHDVETGSLGQGLSLGIGMALGINLKIATGELQSSEKPKVFVLMGDSEIAEGQVWEAAQIAGRYRLDNLVAILDVNRLGQRGETMLGWNVDMHAKRFDAFGWNTIIVQDGHSIEEVENAYRTVFASSSSTGKPTIIIAKTKKGKGISFLENKDGWHGKPVPPDRLAEALAELGEVDKNLIGKIAAPSTSTSDVSDCQFTSDVKTLQAISYKLHDLVATRQAYGESLIELGKNNPSMVVLDAEVSNSTYAELFKKQFPERYFEMYIAEQNMVSVAFGLSKMGFLPYVSSFAAFLTRSFDQLRIGQYFYAQLVTCGSHAGVSIGEDGSSQMGLEDIAMFRSLLKSTVLYPADANATHQLMQRTGEQKGITYLRTTRAALPVIYSEDEVRSFKIGGSKIIHQSSNDVAVVIGAGITLHETLKAYDALQHENISIAVIDLYSIKPLDTQTLQKFCHLPMIVVEDHYPAGGIGEAILSELVNLKPQVDSFTHLCVRNIPHSGSPEQNLQYQNIDAAAIVRAVKNLP